MTTTSVIDVLEKTSIRHSVTVDAGAFTTGLRAVLPHVADEGTLAAVRVEFGPPPPGGDTGWCRLTASSRFTAIVDHHEHSAIEVPLGAGWQVHVWASDLDMVAKMFKPGKDETLSLRLDLAGDGRLTVTEADGLFDGRAYTVPTTTGDDWPDLATLIYDAVTGPREVVGSVSFNQQWLRAFASSSQVFAGMPIHMEPLGPDRPFLVTIGDRVVGLLMPLRHDTDDLEEQHGQVVCRWAARLR